MNFTRQQNSSTRPISFFAVLSSDHVTPATGKTWTLKAAKDATGTGAAISGAVTELDATNLPGWYSWAGNATDRNTLGDLVVTGTATGCDNVELRVVIVPWDLFDGTRLGLTALPNAAPAASGGLPTVDASNNVHGLQIGVDLQTIKTQPITATAGFSYDAQTTAQATIAANLNATVSSRLATTGYTAPDNADIVTALADLVSLLGRTDPTTALTAIKVVTDALATTYETDTLNAGKKRFTAASLVNAPAGGGVGGGGGNVTAIGGISLTSDMATALTNSTAGRLNVTSVAALDGELK